MPRDLAFRSPNEPVDDAQTAQGLAPNTPTLGENEHSVQQGAS